MTREEIVRLDGNVIDRWTLEEIQESKDVKVIRDNGIDGNHLGKDWYVVEFYGGEGINVYCR